MGALCASRSQLASWGEVVLATLRSLEFVAGIEELMEATSKLAGLPADRGQDGRWWGRSGGSDKGGRGSRDGGGNNGNNGGNDGRRRGTPFFQRYQALHTHSINGGYVLLFCIHVRRRSTDVSQTAIASLC